MATTTSSTEVGASRVLSESDGWEAIEAHVGRLVEAGLVLESGWPGSPALLTPIPHGVDVVYDPAKVERVLRCLAALEHTKGRWAGRPLKLLDWQVLYEIGPVFGLVLEATGKRIIRTAYIEKPRKNGKSTECSGLGIYLAFADGELGAEVYAAAKNKDQARIVFAPAKQMAERSGALRKKLGVRGIQRSLLENPSTSSIFRPLARDAGGSLHGLNVHGGIVDELHVHESPDTIDALETGTGSREQPLVVIITTADEGKTGSIYDTKRSYVENLASRTFVDPSFYGVVFAATEEQISSAPFADETIIAANPGVGHTVQMDYLRSKAREAANSPAQLNRYLRLHLGKRTKQSIKFLDLARWDATAGIVKPESDFRGRKTYLGIDLSATTDFTAAAWLAPDPAGGYVAWVHHWIPEERVDALQTITQAPLREWHKAGWLTFTEGNVVDYAKVRADIAATTKRLGCTVVEAGYDPWNAAETVQEMEKVDRLTMVPIRQGYASLSAPTKELERLVMGSTPHRPLLRHGGNPVLRWMADCVEVMQDPGGNIKPTKPDRRKAAQRIDGIAALVNAIARAMLRPQRRAASGSQ